MTVKRLMGKVAIITGASRGIGRSIAVAYAEEGSHVVLVSRNQTEIDLVAREVAHLGVKTLALEADVSAENEVDEMVRKTLQEFKTIDILVNNAGVSGPTGLITQISKEEWDRTMDVNVTGVFLCSKAVLPQMMKQKRGNIINISSGAGKKDRDNSFISPTSSIPYSVSKFALEGFTLALAAQVNTYCINVNALRPGPTDTQMHAASPTAMRDHMRKPEDIKRVALFLACQGPGGITGESISAATWDKIYLNRESIDDRAD